MNESREGFSVSKKNGTVIPCTVAEAGKGAGTAESLVPGIWRLTVSETTETVREVEDSHGDKMESCVRAQNSALSQYICPLLLEF